jgi:uncharacterized membrane protein YbhN (UPF0104 family)
MLIWAVKSLIAILVLAAVGRHVYRTWNDLAAAGVSLHVEPLWLIASGLFYLAGLLACGWFYACILRSSPTPVKLIPSLRAYVVSHLAKYVPGKAMVVIVRAGMVVPFGARASTAAIATFYETLVMMATGGLLAAFCFALAGGSHPVDFPIPGLGVLPLQTYQLCAVTGGGLGVGLLALVLPGVFSRLVRLVTLPVPGVGSDATPRLTYALLLQGILWSAAGWVLLGLSLAAVVRAFDQPGPEALLEPSLLSILIGGVALGTVAGFVVAVMPGGLGVREGVLMYSLAPALGRQDSVVAALVLRLVWVAAELIAAVILLPPFRTRSIEVASPLEAGRSSP